MAAPARPATPTVVAGGLLLLAAVVRVVWLVLNLHLALANDPADYQRLAVSIASGHGFGTTVVAPGGGPTAFRPPLWPLFLGILYWVVGVHVMVARAVEVVLGTLIVGLVGLLARQLWSTTTALVAMAIAAVYPPLLLVGGSLLSEPLSLPLALGSLSAALAARRSNRPWAWTLLSGVLAGLDVLTRPDSFVLLVPIVLLLATATATAATTATGRAGRGGWARAGRGGWARALAAVVVAGLVLTPWLVRDVVVMGRFVPVTTQGGLVASGTYNATAADDPSHPAQWRPASSVPEYRPLLRGTEVEEEAALRKASLHYISEHPLYPLRASWWNLLRLFDLTGMNDPQASWGANGYGPAWSDTDAYGLGVVVALILAGFVTRRFRRGVGAGWWAPVLVVGVAPVLIVLVTIPVLGESRLRVGIDPFLVLGAAAGLVELWTLLSPRRRLSPEPPDKPGTAAA